MRVGLFVTAVLTLLGGGIATASPRVAVSPLRGEDGAECAQTLATHLATKMTVAAWTEVKTGASFKTFEALAQWLEARGTGFGADVVVFGHVLKSGVLLEAYHVERRALIGLEKFYTRGRCRLSRRGLERITTWMEGVTAATPDTASPPPPPPDTEPDEELDPLDSIEEVEEDPPPPAPPTDEIDGLLGIDTATVAEVAPPPPPPRARRQPIYAEAELELGLHRRSLFFSGVVTDNLATFDIGAMPVPGVALRTFFLRGTGIRALAPTYLRTRYGRAVFTTARRAEGPDHDVTYERFEARLGYRLRVPARVPVSVAPSTGVHVMRFSLATSNSGAAELDLPDVAYLSLFIGFDLEAAVAKQTTLVVTGGFLPVVSGGPIFDEGYFPNGSAWGLSVEAGVRYAVSRRMSVMLMGDYLRYELQLDGPAGSTRAASSAEDASLGLRMAGRIIF